MVEGADDSSPWLYISLKRVEEVGPVPATAPVEVNRMGAEVGLRQGVSTLLVVLGGVVAVQQVPLRLTDRPRHVVRGHVSVLALVGGRVLVGVGERVQLLLDATIRVVERLVRT